LIVGAEPPPQFVENKKIVQDTPVKKESSQATMLVSPVKSSPNHTRPRGFISTNPNQLSYIIRTESNFGVRLVKLSNLLKTSPLIT
jgi:hypothetical protein